MRAIMKLAVIVMLAIAIQVALTRHIGRLDLEAFHIRMLIAYARGYPPEHPECLADARRLCERQCKRDALRAARRDALTLPATRPAATQPVWEPDELEP